MRLLIFLITSLSFLQAPCVNTRPNVWRCIIPLQSNRADVQKLIGNPRKSGQPVYETKDELVHIIYSTNPCEETTEGRWNVPADTVITIRVSPKKDVYVNDLHLDESKYRKEEDLHVGGLITYVNVDEGVAIHTHYEKVISTYYRPSATDKHLECLASAP